MRHIAITKQVLDGTEVNSVSLRDLYKSLEIKKDFSAWAKQQIERLNLLENKHYVKHLPQEGEQRIEYIINFDTAKNISLISFTDKGQEVRDYFIAIEKQATQPQKPMTHLETAKMLVNSLEKVEALELRVTHQVETIKAVAVLNVQAGEVTISKFCKNVNIKDMGAVNMNRWLRSKNLLQQNNDPYQTVVDRGYMKMRPTKEQHGGKVRYTTVLTPKGTVWLTKVLIKAGFEIKEVA